MMRSRIGRVARVCLAMWGTTLLAALAAAGSVEIPNSRHQAVDALFAELDRPGSPGAAVGIYQDGRAQYTRGYGYADLEQPAPITPETLFNAASVSKQFTAFAVALLASEGKLSLDADIRTYLPYVPDFGRAITVRQLIHHTSGLRTSEILFELAGQDIRGTVHQQQIPSLVTRQRALNFEPGTEFLYCNMGYSLLAEIVARASGRSFRQFTTERMFKPLGMTGTFFSDDATEIVPRRAQSYGKSEDGSHWVRSLENYDVVGATGLMTSVQDLMKWAGNFSRQVVGDAALIEQIGAPGKLNDGTPVNYGFALSRQTIAGHEALIHHGSSAGYATVFAFFPKRDFGVAILMNAPGDRDGRLKSIADLYLNGGSGKLAPPPAAIAPPADLAEVAVGNYLSEFGPLFSIARDQDGLVMKSIPGGPARLSFHGDGTFTLGEDDDEPYRFSRDSGGKVTGIEEISPTDGRRTLHRRVEPAVPAPENLAELAGDYYSPELDITYALAVENGRLTARSLWTVEPIVFTPSVVDRFDSPWWAMSTIVVQRDASGRPTAIQVHSGRVRHVLLEKVTSAP